MLDSREIVKNESKVKERDLLRQLNGLNVIEEMFCSCSKSFL